MKAVICGGTGFIGTALATFWLNEGHEVIIITRSAGKAAPGNSKLSYLSWDQINRDSYPLEGTDVLVNLAGASLSQRWTRKGKERIMRSRESTVSAVAELIHTLQNKPHTVIQASAIGIYGTSLTETFDENSPIQITDFPSHVVTKWEQAADGIMADRLIKLRIGLVLGNEGGAFPLMKLPFMLGVGGKIGCGDQWVSWIHIDDVVRLIDFCVSHPDVTGPINATAPHAVTNIQFTEAVARAYRRPKWFPLPGPLLKAVIGELSLLLLEGQHVIPAKALAHGFQYRYPDLPEALIQLKEHR